jgi:excisionase family DNA binding protein
MTTEQLGEESDLMTVPEVARELKISRMTVKRMVKDGRLTPVVPHNPALKRQRYQFRRSEVERLKPAPR